MTVPRLVRGWVFVGAVIVVVGSLLLRSRHTAGLVLVGVGVGVALGAVGQWAWLWSAHAAWSGRAEQTDQTEPVEVES